MKLAVSTYSYGRYSGCDELGIIGVMDHAKSVGFSGIEFDSTRYVSDEESLFKVLNHSDKIKLPIIALDIGADFTKNDCTCYEEELEKVMKSVDIASSLGVSIMRHDVSYGHFSDNSGMNFNNVLPLIAECCRKVADYALKRGIKTVFENHGHFIQHHTRVKKLIEEVNHDNFGYLMDIGNFLCVDDDPLTAVNSLVQYADHVHIKDFHFLSKQTPPQEKGWFNTQSGNFLKGSIAGEGCVNIPEIIKILRSKQYNAYLTLEFEGTEDNLIAIRKGYDYINDVIERI